MALIEKTDGTQPSFEELTRAAEEAAGVPSDQELYGGLVEQPEPDEAGRVPASREPAAETEPEPAPEDTSPDEEQPPEQEEEAPEPELAAAVPDKTAELEKKLGQLINENAELRRWQQDQDQRAAMQPPSQQEITWFEQAVEQSPGDAATWAVQQGQPLLYEQAIRAWHDVDPVAAGRFERQQEFVQMQALMQAQIAPQLQGASEYAQRAQLEGALRSVESRHDDFATVMGGLTAERTEEIVQSGFPVGILNDLGGNQQQKEAVLETLYRWVKADQTGTLVAAAAEAATQQKEGAKAAKRAATVASSTTTTPEAVEESEGQRLARVWSEDRPSLREGWTGRDTRSRLGR